MQLIVVFLITVFLLFSGDLKSQIRKKAANQPGNSPAGDSVQTELATFEYPNWRAVDIDFLSSYYEQDGNNSAVTGGIGTEFLTDFTQKVIMSIPLRQNLILNVDGGYDYYSSASTDKVDPVRSDDSASDLRAHGNVGITIKPDKQQSIGFRAGGSVEYDYNSISAGVNYNRLSKSENTSFNAQFQAFVDTWDLIYPIELRGRESLTGSGRQSFNGAIGFSQVLDKKTQVSVQLEATYMTGLLSTPFHRVYLQGEQRARLERLPSTRLKIPVGIRLNRYVTDWLVARASYRFYWDNWGMTAHTASLELPVKVNRFFAIAPFYRYHRQTAVTHFQPFGMHTAGSEFYTSDYDLSALSSHSVGVGVNYQPAGGIAKLKLPLAKGKHIKLKSVDLKYAHYLRSTGLNANIVSFGLGFGIE